MINLKKLFGLNYYVSELDQFLKHFDKEHHKLSKSQRAEKKKYTKVYQLRDHITQIKTTETFWDKF